MNCPTLAISLVSLVLIYAAFFPSKDTLFESCNHLLSNFLSQFFLEFFVYNLSDIFRTLLPMKGITDCRIQEAISAITESMSVNLILKNFYYEDLLEVHLLHFL